MSWLVLESSRVYRGGSWFSVPRNAQVAYRGGGAPGYRDGILGVRLARRAP